MNWEVPLFDLAFDEREENAAREVIRSRWLTQGERTAQFERAFAERCGCAHACAVSSCTAGLHMAVHSLDLEPGSEVILPSLTFVATANTLVQAGLTPVFADVISENRPLIDHADIERKVTPKTRAIVVVHYAGYPCNMTAIVDLANRHNLRVIEDCAHAPFAEWSGRVVGTFGVAGVFSFFSNKNLSAGEGGMIVTDSAELDERFRLIRSHGMTTQTLDRHKGHAFGYDVVELGFNYRFDEIRAAIGLVQLDKVDANNAKRAECDARYRELLADIPWIRIPFQEPFPGRSSHHIFPLLLRNGAPARERLMESLRNRRIQTSIHYRPVHTMSFYQKRFPTPDEQLPVTTSLAPRLLTLPLFPDLTPDQQAKVADALRAARDEN